jgi:hypothetical protein
MFFFILLVNISYRFSKQYFLRQILQTIYKNLIPTSMNDLIKGESILYICCLLYSMSESVSARENTEYLDDLPQEDIPESSYQAKVPLAALIKVQ